MSKREFVTLALTATWAVVALSRAGDEEPADRVPVAVFPLPPNMAFERHVVVADGVTAGTANERLVYSNTLGTFAAALGAGRLVADDIAILAPNGCKLRRLEFPVVGKVDPNGTGGAYSVDFALYSNCPGSVPSASRPALIIPNSAVHADFPDDGPRLISFVAPEGTDVLLRTNFWFGVKFSRSNAGVIVGTPPMTGFSCDQFDFPGFPCSANFGGFPNQPQGSFNAEIFTDADCPNSYTGYKNNRPSGSTYNPGAGITFADDIELSNSGCNAIAYEVAIKGVGFYTFDLRRNCDGGVIAGTETFFTIASGTDVRIARFTFATPIPLPRNLWLSANVSSDRGGVVVAGQAACIGRTEDIFGVVTPTGCTNIDVPGAGVHAAFSAAITCAGAAPVGACCDMFITGPNGEAVCRQVPETNCPFPPRFSTLQPQWSEGASCNPDPFPLPCGVAACCRPDQVCENLTRNECIAVPPIDRPRQWQLGRYCDLNGQQCPNVACLAREGDCLVAHQEAGCEYADCCTDVCNTDSYCCLVEWDRVCVQLAEQMCPNSVGHDECLVGPQSALLVEADSSTFLANTYATESGSDPGFCCRSDAPGSTGFGTVWFKFTATDTSAKISTCNNDPAKDSMFQVFAAGDSSTEERGCATLAMIACSDDVDDCGGGRHGKICVRNLTPGLTYYVMVAAKTSETKGVYQLDIRSPCFDEPIWIADDCNGDGLSDGCEIARGVGADCNLNLILDECEIADGTSLDCNGDSIPDECTSALRVFSPDSPSYSFGAAGAVDGDWVLIGNPYGIGDPDPRAGAAYLFHRTMLTWDKVARLEVPETGRRYFGNSVAMANDEAFVQDFANDEEGMTGVAGAVYVFGHDGADWRFQTKLVVDDPSEWSRTLCQVSVDGDYAAVSACFLGGWFGVPVPAVVYIFHRGSTGWNQEGKLTLPGSVTLGDYAWTIPISLNKNRLAIGAPWESFDDAFQPGAVYVYKRDATGWALESRLTAPDAYMHRNFGAALDLRGDRLVAAVGGAPVSPPMPGAPEMAFQFRRVGSVWGLDGSLSDASAYHSLLDSVAFINDGMTLVGAAGGPHGADFAYVFQRLSTGVWGKVATLGAPAQFSSSTVNYPTVVRAGRDFAIVGVWNPEPSNVEPHGSAYLFAISGGDCNQNGVTDGCDIRDRTSADCDHNGVPDECETLPPFDYDFDGDVDLIDLAGFQRCFTGPATVALCCRMFDSDPDGDVDGDDFVAFSRAFTGP